MNLACIAAASAMIFAAPVSAATMKAVYSGTVQNGYDYTGVLGTPETDLTGLSFLLTFIYDTAKGTRKSGSVDGGYYTDQYDELTGGTNAVPPADSPYLSATLHIDGTLKDFVMYGLNLARISTNTSASVYPGSIATTGFLHDAIEQGVRTDAINGTFNFDHVLRGQLRSPDTQFADLDVPMILEPSGSLFNYPSIFSVQDVNYGTGVYVNRADAALVSNRLMVTRLDVAPVPLPSSIYLAFLAFTALFCTKLRKNALTSVHIRAPSAA